MLLIPEILRHGQSGFSHAHTGPRRLVHLTEHQGRFLQNSGFLHLGPEVVSLAGALAHAGENGVTAVLGGDIADQLLNEYGLTHAGAAEQADFTALSVGS